MIMILMSIGIIYSIIRKVNEYKGRRKHFTENIEIVELKND